MLATFCDNSFYILLQIFVWSMKTGRLLDILGGHEGPVHGLMFSPTNVSHNVLYIYHLDHYNKFCDHFVD